MVDVSVTRYDRFTSMGWCIVEYLDRIYTARGLDAGTVDHERAPTVNG